jgi:transcriptional regulator with XRE-family HTH domain
MNIELLTLLMPMSLTLVKWDSIMVLMSTTQELLEQLLSAGWTETQIAARLGVSSAAVNRWRKGTRTPPLAKLVEAELRRMLRVKLDSRVKRSPARNRNP